MPPLPETRLQSLPEPTVSDDSSLCLYEINHRAQSISKDASQESTEVYFGLEETTARTISGMKRLKFLMSERKRV